VGDAEEVTVSRKAKTETSTTLAVRMLDEVTWPAFARLVEANNGIWGGCWCMSFHVKLGKGRTPEQNRAEKEQRVREGRTHAALVFDGDECVGWCQFGSPAELPEIKSRRRYEKDLATLPDWRITCFFTGKGLRKRGVARAALGGALAEIARRGGGAVEGYPEETDDRSVSGSFLHTGPMAVFESHGFTRTRPISPHRWVVTRTVGASLRGSG
jgi:GNAT superfamily N-acetyltransferase